MKKDDLKALVTKMYENLLENIDNQVDANKEQVINYLRDAIDEISSISDEKISLIDIQVAQLKKQISSFNNSLDFKMDEIKTIKREVNDIFESLTKKKNN